MGVDYRAVFGLGYRIKVGGDIDERQNILDVLDEDLDSKLYRQFETGCLLEDQEIETFVVLRNPFRTGLSELIVKSNLLLYHLTEIGIEVDGEFDIHGGLRIS